MGNTRDKKIGEIEEVLDAIGHENEKEGIKWTKYFMEQWDQAEWKKNQIKQKKIERATRWTKREYYHTLAKMLGEEILDMDIPFGYTPKVEETEEGILLRLTDRWGKKWRRGYKPSGTPELDYRVTVGLLIDLQETIDSLEEEAKRNMRSLGLVLPA